ncbi:MAG: pyridoxamine 5'-phosphate oxidase family protein [Planctomycetaceae bacterium]|nr:pyridoxamine 5'-phosphate oxidase family protein [Planctomycetaceae bacterium]
MNQPISEPIRPDEVPGLAADVVTSDRFPVLATIDEKTPRVRPVSPVKTEGFTVWVANLKSYHKTQEIAANPNVELCYVNQNHDQVRITGVATTEERAEVIQEIWNANPLLRNYLGSPDNQMLIIYRIEPTQVRYMKEWALEYHEVTL